MKINHWRALSVWCKRSLSNLHAANDYGEKKFGADVGCDDAHWQRARDIFISAFHKYPLYEYIVPDERKRPEFLRRYLDAVFHASNVDRLSVLVMFKDLVLHSSKSVVGATLLLRPCFKGKSWKDLSDEETANAYDRFKLNEIDSESFTRLKRYEQWESKNITHKLRSLGYPTWNSMFYGIDPKLAGAGNGRNGFVDGMNLLVQLQRGIGQSELKKSEPNGGDTLFKTNPNSLETSEISDSTFLVLGISHCERAAHFHRKNGMLDIASVPYSTSCGSSPFNVHILYYDPFETGNLQEIQKVFEKPPL